METCSICGMEISPSSADERLRHSTSDYHFYLCSEQWQRVFETGPERHPGSANRNAPSPVS
jgi:YHS domain-containing protein